MNNGEAMLTKLSSVVFCSYVHFNASIERRDLGISHNRSWQMNHFLAWFIGNVLVTFFWKLWADCILRRGKEGVHYFAIMYRIIAIRRENFVGSKFGEFVGKCIWRFCIARWESAFVIVLCVYSIARKTVNEQLNSRCRFSALTATFMFYKDVWSPTAGEELVCERVCK